MLDWEAPVASTFISSFSAQGARGLHGRNFPQKLAKKKLTEKGDTLTESFRAFGYWNHPLVSIQFNSTQMLYEKSDVMFPGIFLIWKHDHILLHAFVR